MSKFHIVGNLMLWLMYMLNVLEYTNTCTSMAIWTKLNIIFIGNTGLQIYGGPGSLSHDFKIWPITFQGSGPSGPILFSCEKIYF